jgi:hypothetical protein
MTCRLVFIGSLLLASTASAQTHQPIKVRVVYDTTDASSSAVAPLLIQRIAAQPKFFAIVKSGEQDMSVVADCYRDTMKDPYSCFYATSEINGINESFLGGAVVVKKSAQEAATALFASILLDVSQRWNATNRRILIGELESCLTLTESSCAVPALLVSELKTKSINLSQYMRMGGLKP